jgi:choloylglycine hydrolase
MKANSRPASNIFTFVLAALLSLGISTDGFACSAVAGSDGAVVGGNYDWYARGGIVFVSPRGQVKSSEVTVEKALAAHWVSRFGSVTISQFGRDFPMQGMNEAGLAGMVLVGDSKYPASRAGATLTENLWLQYQLDNYETIDEVVRHAGDLGIKTLSASLHWFICDRSRACAVIEFLNGQAVVHAGDKLPVAALTNTTYDAAASGYQNWRGTQEQVPEGYDSLARFIRLAESGGRDVKGELDDVSQRGLTAVQTVFDMEQRSFTSRVEDGPWVNVSFRDISFDCGSMPQMLSLSVGTWETYNHDAVVDLFTRGTRGTTGLGPEIQDRILKASEQISCQ